MVDRCQEAEDHHHLCVETQTPAKREIIEEHLMKTQHAYQDEEAELIKEASQCKRGGELEEGHHGCVSGLQQGPTIVRHWPGVAVVVEDVRTDCKPDATY